MFLARVLLFDGDYFEIVLNSILNFYRSICFSQYVTFLDLIKWRLEKAGFKVIDQWCLTSWKAAFGAVGVVLICINLLAYFDE